MYFSSVLISLAHVDSVGVIFYPRLFHMSQLVMEGYLNSLEVDAKGNSQFSLINAAHNEKQIPLVVHCEASYFSPISLSDIFLVDMSCIHIGSSSFSLMYHYICCKDTLLMRKYDNAVKSNNKKDIHNLAAEVSKNGKVHAQCKVVHTVVDFTTRAKTTLSQNWVHQLRALQKKTG